MNGEAMTAGGMMAPTVCLPAAGPCTLLPQHALPAIQEARWPLLLPHSLPPQAPEEGKSSPAKSVDASAFHLSAHAGMTAEHDAAAGQVVASHSQAGQRPSR